MLKCSCGFGLRRRLQRAGVRATSQRHGRRSLLPLPVLLGLPTQPPRTLLPAGSDALLLLYVSLLGSAASYGVFFYNASRGSLTALSSLTFLTPCFAAAGGYLALGESLTPLQLAGAAVTLGAVALINNSSHQGDSAAAADKAE